jgi:RNA polymerase sigma-70 factor (family 1)
VPLFGKTGFALYLFAPSTSDFHFLLIIIALRKFLLEVDTRYPVEDQLASGFPEEEHQFFNESQGPIHRRSNGSVILFEDTLRAFNSGSQSAFTTLYHHLYPSIYIYARRFASREDAQDITNEAFLKIWRMEKRFARLQSINLFLRVSVRNACFDLFRHDRFVERKKKELLRLSEERQDALYFEDEISAEYLQRIYKEIEKLAPQRKKIFKLAYLDGLKEKTIAEKLNLSRATVHNQKSKALRQLRIALLQIVCLLLLIGILPIGST